MPNSYDNYEPSKAVKYFIPGIANDRIPINNEVLPGLFDDKLNILRTLGFFSIIILEGYATLSIKNVGIKMLFIWISLGCDIAFAVLAHVCHRWLQVLRNSEHVINRRRSIAIEKTHLDKQINKNKSNQSIAKFLRFVCYLIVITSCLYKAFSYSLKIEWVQGPSFYAVWACYILAALFHMFCTGPVIFKFFYNLLNRINKFQYNNSNEPNIKHKAHVTDHPINNSTIDNNGGITKVAFKPLETDKHKLYLDNQTYYLKTQGILWDIDLINFTKEQDPLVRDILALEILDRQMTILNR